MNRVYRVIWSKALCSWVVVCELTRRGGKSGGSIVRKRRRSGLVTAAGALLATSALADPAATALPSGGQVAAGQAAISQSGNTLTIRQSSAKAIVNWNSFDVGAEAAVKFAQPGADSVILNRVQSQNPSQIFGALSANGQVFLLNANGVIFGPQAKVDVGGIVAGAMKITDEDFLAGRYKFTDGKGVVTNKGTITAGDGGLIALLAPEVRNEGIIRARLGTIVLAAGEAVTLTNSASGITVVIDKGAFNALVHNGNLVAAEDGRVFMSARAADTLQRAVIRNTGVIEAHNARRVGSVIRLEADSVDNSGIIDASGAGTAPGGSIAIIAGDVTNSGRIAANGGGDIRIAAARAVRNDGAIETSGGTVAVAAGTAVTQSTAGVIRTDADQHGGTIKITAAETVTLSGAVDASSAGTGGTIDITSPHTAIANATLNVNGETAGGTILLKPQPPLPDHNPQPDPSTLLINNAVLSSASRRGNGGLIDVGASDVTVDNGAKLVATGGTGGGRIFVGGHWQGGDGALQATHSTVGATTLLDASAADRGDGGVIAVWSDVHNLDSATTVSGTLRATGGSLGGNGGRIETSGHVVDTSDIAINASAPRGTGGLWLLDPYDYTIGATQAGYISTALTAGTSVTISTQSATNTQTGNTISGASGNGDITVSSAITKSGGGTASLILQADRNITISSGANITSTSGKLNVTLSADNAGSATVGGISIGANLSSNGGVILIGGAAGSVSHGIGYARNQTSSTPAVAIQANVAISSGGADITINGTTTGTATSYTAVKGGVYFLSGSSVSSSGGNIYISGISTADSKEFGIGFEANAGTVTTLSVGGTSGQIFIDGQNTVNSLGALGMAQNGQKANIVFAAPSVAGIIISVNGVLQTSTFTFSSSCDATFQNCGLQQVDGGNNSYLYASYRAVNMATHAFYVTTSTTSRVYDGTTNATGLTLTTTAAPPDYSTSGLSFTTASKNVGTYATSTPSGTYATGFHSTSTGYDYAIGYFYNPYTITAKPITAITGISGLNKQYDGGTSITLNAAAASFTGKIAGDTLTVASGTGTFSSKTVGTGKTVNITGLTLGGTDAGNYTLSSSTASATADITAKVLTISGLTIQNKSYDGTTTATFSGTPSLSGVIGGETVTLSGTANAAFADKNAGTGKTVTVTGLSLSGTDAGNYTLTGSTSTATADITAAAISAITGITASSKTYDGTTAATLDTGSAGFTGKISGDTLTVAAGSGTFGNKNVGTGKTVSITGLTLGGADAGNYTLSSSTASTSADITAATITAITGITAANKTYDGNTSASLATSGASFTGKIAGDTLTVASATGAFGDKTAANGKTVTITGLSLGGTDAGNYTLASSTASAAADITVKVLTITGVSINNKTYDGTTAATLSGAAGLSGIIGGDDVSASGSATATFADKNVGNGKTVDISGLTLSGADAGNYTMSGSTASATANITAAAITAITGISAANKTYDGTAAASLVTTGASFTGKIGGDSLTIASGTGNFADKNAADGKTVNITGLSLGGADAGNYVLSTTTASTTANISKAIITAINGITAFSKTYDGTRSATLDTSAAAFAGKISGDTLVVASGTGAFADKNAADGKTVSITGLALGGAEAGNYTLFATTASTTANISKTAVTAITGITAANKTYDGTTAAALDTSEAIFTGKISGDTLTVAGGTGTFADKTAADGKTVSITGLTLGGTDAGNYTLSSTIGSTTANIAKATVSTITGLTAGNKTYDGTTAATIDSSAAVFNGKISGDTLTVANGAGSFSDKTAADGKTVFINGLTLGGTDAGNYTLASTTGSATANISAKELIIAGVSINNKVYDGTTTATLSGAANLSGIIGSDDVSASGSAVANFDNKNVGAGKTVDISGLALSGADAANYSLTGSIASATANITAATITAITGITAADKTYDGTVNATLVTTGASFSGKIGGDSLTVASSSGAFADKGAANGKTVSITGLTLGGADAGNYALATTTASTTANITKAAISAIGGITAANKTYDGTAAATVDTSGATFTGKIASDVLTVVSAAGSFADKNAGSGKTVTITGLTLGGADAGNYTLTSVAAPTTASISAKRLTVTGIGVANKVYDGTATATLSGAPILSGVVGSDDVSASGSVTANFTDKDAGSGKTVNISGLALTGADAGNYSLATSTASATADIAKASISAVTGITAANKLYDGTTAAALNTAAAGFTGKIAGDTLTVASGSGSFADKNASPDKIVSIIGLALGGADAANYTLVTPTASASAGILTKSLAVSNVIAANKVYDGTTAAALTGAATLTGLVGSDDVGLSAAAVARFADRNAGDGKTVIVTGLALDGADAANYTLANTTASTTAAIIPAVLHITSAPVSKTYDGTTDASGTLVLIDGTKLYDGDSLSGGTFTFSDKNAGTKTLTVSGAHVADGNNGGNYTTVYIANTASTIRKATITAITGVTAGSKTYDGTTAAVLNTGSAAFTGRVAGDDLALGPAIATFADKNAGNGKTITVTGLTLGGADAANYIIAFASFTTTASIAPKAVTVTGATVTNKTFDNTDTATINGASLTSADIISGDQVSLANQTSGTFANNGPATGIAVSTAMTLTGRDAANYVLTQPAGLTGDINATQSAPRQPDTTAVVPTAPATITTPVIPSTSLTVPAPVISTEVTVAAIPAATPTAPSTYALTTTSTGTPTTLAASGTTTPRDSQGFTSVRNFDTLSVNSGSSFAFTLPSDTFKHSDNNATISLSATTQSGSPLPDWVRFSSEEHRFTGTAPNGLTELKLVVTAHDKLGNEATTTITLHFGSSRKA
jgi:filamentous hemagglutinin family protein